MLIVVIWLIGILSLAALSFGQSVRDPGRTVCQPGTDRQGKGVCRCRSGACATSHAGKRYSYWCCNRASPAVERWQDRNLPFADGSVLRLTLADTASRVDLNTASAETLMALITGVGMKRLEARPACGGDHGLPRCRPGPSSGRGRSRSNIGPRAFLWSPRNAPFESIEDAGFVLGMTDTLLHRLRPHLTIRSGQRGIDSAHCVSRPS